MDLSSSVSEVIRGKDATRLETTRWTMVLAAGQGSRKALEELGMEHGAFRVHVHRLSPGG